MKASRFMRITAALVLCAMLAGLLCGCGKSTNRDVIIYEAEKTEAEKTQLTFFGYKADAINLTAIETALGGFMEENGDIDISYEGVKGSAYWESFAKRAETDNMDDLMMIDHDRVISLGGAGKLADLSDVAGLENFTIQARQQFTNPDGSVWFLPTCISTYNLYINYDLLEANSIAVPTDWESFSRACDYFADMGVTPIIANNYNSIPTLIVARALFDTYQQTNTDELIEAFNEQPELLAQELRLGVDMAAEMLACGWFDAEEVKMTAQTSDDLSIFAEGTRPFMITGGWASIRVTAKEPDFSFGVHPYPILEDGCVLSMDVNTCVAVSADSEDTEAAKKFVAYLIRPDVMWAYCDSQASYTPLHEEKRLPSEQTLVPSTAYLINGRSVIGADYRLTVPIFSALTACTGVLLDGGTAEEAQEVLTAALCA